MKQQMQLFEPEGAHEATPPATAQPRGMAALTARLSSATRRLEREPSAILQVLVERLERQADRMEREHEAASRFQVGDRVRWFEERWKGVPLTDGTASDREGEWVWDRLYWGVIEEEWPWGAEPYHADWAHFPCFFIRVQGPEKRWDLGERRLVCAAQNLMRHWKEEG